VGAAGAAGAGTAEGTNKLTPDSLGLYGKGIVLGVFSHDFHRHELVRFGVLDTLRHTPVSHRKPSTMYSYSTPVPVPFVHTHRVDHTMAPFPQSCSHSAHSVRHVDERESIELVESAAG
jgi:hypothetical protein